MQNKLFKIIMSSAVALGFISSNANFENVASLNIQQSQKNKEEMKAKIEALRHELMNTQKNINEESKNKENLDLQIKELQEKIDETNKKINNLSNQILEIESQMEEIQKDIDKKIELLREALVMMYKAGDASTLDIVLGSKDFSDFLEKNDIVKSVGNTVEEIIDDLNEKSAQLEIKKIKISEIKKEQEEQSAQLEQDRANLQTLIEKSQQMINEYKESEEQTKQDISKNESAMKAVDDEIKRYYEEQRKKEEEELRKKQKANKGKPSVSYTSANSSKVVNQGGYLWPVPGFSRISSNFYDTEGRKSMHGAIDIAGGGIYGANVVASGAGTVIRVQYSGSGYGNNITIDHGNGISTQYSHLSGIAVSNGQKVSRGQVIGQVGNSGFSTGPHLDFTVRVNGTKVDPLKYVSP